MCLCSLVQVSIRYLAALGRKCKRTSRTALHVCRTQSPLDIIKAILHTKIELRIKVLILAVSLLSVSVSLSLQKRGLPLDRDGEMQVKMRDADYRGFLQRFHLDSPHNLFSKNVSSLRKCDGDCLKIKELQWDWPEDKPMATFYILTKGNKKRNQMLLKSLNMLYENFNKVHQYPVVIFHEAGYESFKTKIQNKTQNRIFFQEINFQVPTFLKRNVPENISCTSLLGYRHMCRFHAKNVYEEPIIRGFRYVFRLDDDSLITRPIKYDIFEFMRTNNLVYGYKFTTFDVEKCIEGLWEATAYFINITGTTPQFFHSWRRLKMYYNNFEISRTDLWLSKNYVQYINYLDRLGGIYYHRWGDAPIKGLAVSLFVPLNQTHHFKDVGYKHGSYEG